MAHRDVDGVAAPLLVPIGTYRPYNPGVVVRAECRLQVHVEQQQPQGHDQRREGQARDAHHGAQRANINEACFGPTSSGSWCSFSDPRSPSVHGEGSSAQLRCPAQVQDGAGAATAPRKQPAPHIRLPAGPFAAVGGRAGEAEPNRAWAGQLGQRWASQGRPPDGYTAFP